MLPQTITVNVTQEDIDEGQRHQCRRCPIALAASMVIPVAGVTDDIYVDAENDDITFYELPEEAKKFIERFDANAKVEPFQFVATLRVIKSDLYPEGLSQGETK